MWNIKKIISKGDYNYALVPDHPNCTKNGYVLEHRIIMENHLGRLLNASEVVHHKDNNKKNNHIDNLELTNKKEHAKKHGIEKGRQMVVLCCPECGREFIRFKSQCFLSKGTLYTCCSRSCSGKFSRKMQLYGRTPEVKDAISGNLVSEYRRYLDDNPEETN